MNLLPLSTGATTASTFAISVAAGHGTAAAPRWTFVCSGRTTIGTNTSSSYLLSRTAATGAFANTITAGNGTAAAT